jgi:hypothetical protein
MRLGDDQKQYKTTIPPLDCDQQEFYWIFRNIDFLQWKNPANGSKVLWLSGPPECSIHRVSSYIIEEKALKTEYRVLYFFCSAAVRQKSIASLFVLTLLYQTVCYSPIDSKISVFKRFLRILHRRVFEKKGYPWKQLDFKNEDSPDEDIKKILQAPAQELLATLKAVLTDEEQRELLIVVDGLDKIEDQKVEFLHGVSIFVKHLLEKASKVKILITSRSQKEIKAVFDWLPCIEYDKERKGKSIPYILLI